MTDQPDEQIKRLVEAVKKLGDQERQEMLTSQSSFVGFVNRIGMHMLAAKIADMAAPLWAELWEGLTNFVDALSRGITVVIEEVSGFFEALFE